MGVKNNNEPDKMKAFKLDLTVDEKEHLKKNKISKNKLADLAVDELCEVLHISNHRAKQLQALIHFQSFASIGPKFAQDLIDMGYYSIDKFKHKQGAELLDEHELFINACTDPCVEDQFRLIVHYANHPGIKKQWWDMTAERKAYRAKYGYPVTRPIK